MVADLTYRTDDPLRWLTGNGSDLLPVQVDLNFWTLFSAVLAIEAQLSGGAAAGIDFINQPSDGNLFFVHLTDHRVLGPFTIPTAQWHAKGAWLPATLYAAFDVVTNNGSVYLITQAHTSAGSFSPTANDGFGHELYALLITTPGNSIPSAGTRGQRLVKSTSSPYVTEWEFDKVRMFVQVSGVPDAGELLLQYPVVDFMTLPSGLVGSAFYEAIPGIGPSSYPLSVNGAAIGSVDFNVSPVSISVTLAGDHHLVPGDVLTLNAPAVPDTNQADISFTLVALLTE